MTFKFLNKNFYIINESAKNLGNFILETNYLNIRLIWNEGIAFGLLSFNSRFFYNSLSILILMISGALGNFYDRIFYQAVPDFIDFHINNFHWFIFNLADIYITLGVLFMIVLEIFDKNNYEKN